jgi:hypothetical protein
MLSRKEMEVYMSLTVQMGFWQNKVLADTRRKLAELYYKKPEIANSEKRCILEYWSTYEGLSEKLGDKYPAFVDWFMSATSPETITRCLRALKEDGTIKLSEQKKRQRGEREQQWHQYWAK